MQVKIRNHHNELEYEILYFKLPIKLIRKSENYLNQILKKSQYCAEVKTRYGCGLNHVFTRISMKYFTAKIVFNKNPVENTDPREVIRNSIKGQTVKQGTQKTQKSTLSKLECQYFNTILGFFA